MNEVTMIHPSKIYSLYRHVQIANTLTCVSQYLTHYTLDVQDFTSFVISSIVGCEDKLHGRYNDFDLTCEIDSSHLGVS